MKTAALQVEGLSGEGLAEFQKETGLADSRLPYDAHHLAGAGLNLLIDFHEGLYLPGPADKASQAPGGSGGEATFDFTGAQELLNLLGFFLALDLQFPQRLKLEEGLD